MRVAIYCRVSTKGKQDVETQLLPLREYVSRRGFTVAAEHTDIGVSGVKDSRPGLDALMKAARAREVDVVLVARFDRFARSVSHLVKALEEFQALGVEFISLNESCDTTTPMGKMVFTVLGAVAELERSIIVERVKAGMSRAKKQGKAIGRPKVIFNRDRALRYHQEGLGVRKIADKLGCSRETVRLALRGA